MLVLAYLPDWQRRQTSLSPSGDMNANDNPWTWSKITSGHVHHLPGPRAAGGGHVARWGLSPRRRQAVRHRGQRQPLCQVRSTITSHHQRLATMARCPTARTSSASRRRRTVSCTPLAVGTVPAVPLGTVEEYTRGKYLGRRPDAAAASGAVIIRPAAFAAHACRLRRFF